MRAITILLLGGLVASPISGQSAGPAAGTRPRLSITRTSGWTFSSAESQLENQLIHAGYDQSSPPPLICFQPCGTPTRYPIGRHPTAPRSITVRYALTDLVALAGGYTRQGLGGAIGRRNSGTYPFGTSDLIRSVWVAEAYWVGAAIYPVRNLRVAAGPGRYRLESEDHQFTKVGLLAEIGLEVFMGRHIFLDLAFRGHRVGTRDVADGPSGVTLRTELNHATAEIGLGVAF